MKIKLLLTEEQWSTINTSLRFELERNLFSNPKAAELIESALEAVNDFEFVRED